MGKFATKLAEMAQLDELSNEKVQAYKVAAKMDKWDHAANVATKHLGKDLSQEELDKIKKRDSGIAAANKRLATKAESVEPLDELSKQTLKNYQDAARTDKRKSAALVRHGLETNTHDQHHDDYKNMMKRIDGIDAAKKRLATKAEGTEMGKFASKLGTVAPVTEATGQVDEALRKIAQHEYDNRKATVHRDNEWEEYRVKHHVDGKHQTEADYHTTDKQDALDHAEHWAKKIGESTESPSTVVEATLINEKAEEFKGHRSNHTGVVYHTDSTNTNKMHALKHGDAKVIEAVHHDGYNLHVKKYEANRVRNTIHLHDRKGNHVDSFAL